MIIKKLISLICCLVLFSTGSAAELFEKLDDNVLPRVVILKWELGQADGLRLPLKRSEYERMPTVVAMLKGPEQVASEDKKPEIELRSHIVSLRAVFLLQQLIKKNDEYVFVPRYHRHRSGFFGGDNQVLVSEDEDRFEKLENELAFLTDKKRLRGSLDRATLLVEVYRAMDFLGLDYGYSGEHYGINYFRYSLKRSVRNFFEQQYCCLLNESEKLEITAIAKSNRELRSDMVKINVFDLNRLQTDPTSSEESYAFLYELKAQLKS